MQIFAILLTLSLIASPVKAYAYLDPGTGSYFIQIILAFIFGGFFTLKIYWKKIIDFCTKLGKYKKDEKNLK